MTSSPGHVIICSCEDTMPLDAGAVRRGCRGKEVTSARQLCRSELDRFRALAGGAAPLTVGCTQEAPLFSEIAAENGRTSSISYANLRETAGWSSDGAEAGPKMAALLAAAAEPVPDVPLIDIESNDVVLVYGRGEEAVEAGTLLKEHLDVTVMIEPPAAIAPPRMTDFPVVKGKIRTAAGHFGAFNVTVDDFAQPTPSSRGVLSFGSSRDGVRSRCGIILDLSGGAALFTAAVFPTSAASYAMPPADTLMRKLRAMLRAYREAGGERAVVLVHDDPHGAPLIDALARFGDGLPANVLPLAVNEVTQAGLEIIAAALAYGASALRFLLRDRPRHDVAGLRRSIVLANTILA